MALIIDPDFLNKNTEVTIVSGTRLITLNEAGNLSSDGVTLQALYSFLKEEWKSDASLIPYPFPMVAITPEQFEFVSDWRPSNDPTRKLVRTGGWSEVTSSGVISEMHTGVVTLGSFEDDTNDTAYFQFGTDTTVDDTTNFTYAGPVNEAVRVYKDFANPNSCNFASATTITRGTGSFITDGYKVGGQVTIRNAAAGGNNGTFALTAVAATTLTAGAATFTTGADPNAQLAVNNRNALAVRLRVRDGDTNGKTYAQSNLAAIGTTTVDNKVFRFPLSNATDLKISATDASIDADAPYTGMDITYHPTAQARLIGGISRDFGIIIDGNDGSAEEIYEFVQRQLRKTTDIDADSSILIGRSGDALLEFVGDTLKAGTFIPGNPSGGGSGVYIDNFDSNDTNRLVFVDNTSTERTFPFVAAGTINFNANLVSDGVAKYWMFFEYTTRTTVNNLALSGASGSNATFTGAGATLPTTSLNDYIALTGSSTPANNGIWRVTSASPTTTTFDATKVDGATVANQTSFVGVIDENPINSPGALLVKDNSTVNITGNISTSSVSFDFDYDNNVQGGRVAATDASVVLRAIGLTTSQFVETTATITRNTGLSFSLVSALERNYSNP